MIELTPVVIAHFLPILFLGSLAWISYKARPFHPQNRRLAVFHFLTGLFSVQLAVVYGATSARVVLAASTLSIAFLLAVALVYLRFAATFETPFSRVLRNRWVDGFLVVACIGTVPAAILLQPYMIDGVVPSSVGPWSLVRTPEFDYLFDFDAIVLTLVAINSIWAWRLARPGSALRRQLGWYAVAAVTFDVQVVFRTAFLLPWLIGRIREGDPPPTWVVEASLIHWPFTLILLAVMLAYAFSKTSAFDIDLKIKWTIVRGTVASIFLAVFFVVGLAASEFLVDRFGYLVGAAAAGLLLFALRPLQALGRRIADAAMPGVEDTPEYHRRRAHGVYQAAFEAALVDGVVTERERDMLAALQEKLDLRPTEARALERAVSAPTV